MRSLRCTLGIHRWLVEHLSYGVDTRRCTRCGKAKMGRR